MKDADRVAIVQELQRAGIITVEQLNQLTIEANTTGTDVLTLLTQKHVVSDEELTKAQSEVFHVPYVNLLDQEIPNDVLNVVTQDIAENYQVVPWSKQGSEVSVAMVNPLDYKAIEALDFIARRDQLSMKFFMASEPSVRAVLRQYGNLNKEVEKALKAQASGDVLNDQVIDEEVESGTDASVKSAPISKMVAVIMRYAVEGSASDVHIEPADDGTRVRYRVDGVLHTSLHLPKNVHNALVARIKVLANLKLDETRLPQDGRFRMSVEGRPVDFRVSTLPLIGQEKVVLRILDKSTGLRTLENLGFTDRNLQIVQEHLRRPHGMILVTGPTGSGKSTTLYSMLQILNEEQRNIVTLEDPVEYHIPGVSQSQVHPDIGLTFAMGLRSVLRQDPDIIMVGEIRDNETAELGIHAALTGHMLLSTLHTNDAIGAIPRLVDMQIEPFLISSSLNLIVAQRLVRKSCEHCQVKKLLPVKMESEVILELQKIPAASLPRDISLTLPLQVTVGEGCQHCDNTGYRGRIAILETVEVTERLKEIIASGEINHYSVVQEELRSQGMIAMKQDGFIKALRGATTIEEVWTATKE